MPKTKAKRVEACNCIDQVNKQLEKYNTYVPRELTFNFKTGKSALRLAIPTAKIDSSKSGRAKVVFAAYCPVCGKSLEPKAARTKRK